MELSSIQHIEPDKLNQFEPDVFINTLGYESRAAHVARLLNEMDGKKIALSFSEMSKQHSYEENLKFFDRSGFDIHPVTSGVPDFGSLLAHHDREDVRIMIDCTSMPQLWYYELFRWFSENLEVYSKACIRFVYTMAEYVEPGPPQKVRLLVDFTKS